MNKRSRLGVTLIGVGLVLLLGQLNWVGDQIFLYLLSLALFAAYKFTGGTERYSSIGFLIPSLILLAIGVFANLERLLRGNLSGGWFFLFLAAAFWLVYIIHTRHAREEGAARRWPLFPATALAAFGVFVTLVEQVETWRRAGVANYLFPSVLIVLGLYLVWKQRDQQD